MRLFFQDDREVLSEEKVVNGLKQVYGMKHPEQVHGFNGFFFSVLDVYVAGRLEMWLQEDPKLSEELDEFINRYSKEDYGLVNGDEYENNVENRWIAGSSNYTIARYISRSYDVIVLQFFEGVGFIYSIYDNAIAMYEDYKRLKQRR